MSSKLGASTLSAPSRSSFILVASAMRRREKQDCELCSGFLSTTGRNWRVRRRAASSWMRH
eukprot:3683705-Pleurochrysis_carterae.AAC.2